MDAKERAARRALDYVQDGMTLGLGTGTTATYFLRALGERVRHGNLQILGVPTSERSRQIAQELHVPLTDWTQVNELDLTIDGADEVDPALHLIKGGGGALVREKIVAVNSKQFYVICDDSKLRPCLGAFPLPVAVLPFGWQKTQRALQRFAQTITLREGIYGEPFVTDDGLYILDMHLGMIRDAAALERNIQHIVGVVEVGLFVDMATKVIIGFEDGHLEERDRAPADAE
jgi:ribose 5-phosphate isomerase A